MDFYCDVEGSPAQLASAWALTRAVSPRPVARVAAVDGAGVPLNLYPSTVPVAGPPPLVPWAVHLAGGDGGFVLVVFDFDEAADGDPAGEAERVAGLLRSAGARPLVCASSGAGSARRHVWVRLSEPVSPEVARKWARAAALACPSLDPSPLMNPATGCVRPPGAPHRGGGRSVVVGGDVEGWLSEASAPAAVAAAVDVLRGEVSRAAAVDVSAGRAASPGRGPVVVDERGFPRLPGARRALPPGSAAASRGVGDDASRTLAGVLAGAARARWSLAEVRAELGGCPGLEHARTRRAGAGRRERRSPGESARVLEAAWARAVDLAASTAPVSGGGSDVLDGRLVEVVAAVEDVQSRADAAAGRWTRGRGAAQRRVLDALCRFALQAVRTGVEADVRRLALTVGVGRESARLALRALAVEGWIRLSVEADGVHGHTWELRPPPGKFSTSSDIERGHKSVTPPGGSGLSPVVGAEALEVAWVDRDYWLQVLGRRVEVYAHPWFSSAGAGFAVGNLRARAYEEQTRLPNWDELDRLASGPGGPAEVVAARRAAYAAERAQWAWWTSEVSWLRAPRHARAASRRPGFGQLDLEGRLATAEARYPRGSDGRPDHVLARVLAAA
ncbi:MAG: hypothetical protein QM621_08170 [Aeromicrobium sp.]|uniref:hypothetical protein n=1 Tax=Aeromicrobium sp. TaxID=1871063 RepID=UPI0039E22776